MIRRLQAMTFVRITLLLLAAVLSGCATLPGRDAPSVQIIGFEPLPGEGLELRFALKLRVQNLNENALAYDGLSVTLDLDGRGVANGVSNSSGEIPRFSEAVLTVPVSISAFSAFRQMFGRVTVGQGGGDALTRPISYSLKGKLGGVDGSFATRFGDQGELDLFTNGSTGQPDNVE